MADQNDKRTSNQPSHDAQVKGGQHSHQGAQHGSNDANVAQPDQGSAGQGNKQQGGRGQNPPGHDEQVKGGEHSHSGSQKKK